VLPDLPGRQRRVEHLRHHLVTGRQGVPVTATGAPQPGEDGTEQPVPYPGEEFDWQLAWQVNAGQGYRGQHAARPQAGRQSLQRAVERHMVQGRHRNDRVIAVSRQRVAHDVGLHESDVARHCLPGCRDHLR